MLINTVIFCLFNMIPNLFIYIYTYIYMELFTAKHACGAIDRVLTCILPNFIGLFCSPTVLTTLSNPSHRVSHRFLITDTSITLFSTLCFTEICFTLFFWLIFSMLSPVYCTTLSKLQVAIFFERLFLHTL